MKKPAVTFDPYALFEALERHRVSYVVIGAFARVVHGSGERTSGLDIAPSLREENLRRLGQALSERGTQVDAAGFASSDRAEIRTDVGEVGVSPTPWGTRGYDDLRIRAFRENLGRGLRPQVASLADCVRMLAASSRDIDAERLQRLRRLIELERQLVPHRRLGIER